MTNRRLRLIESEQRMPLGDEAEWRRRVMALEHRMAALEARKPPRKPAALAQRNAEEHSRSTRLRETIRQLLEQHPGARHGTAKRIYPHLLQTDIGRFAQPSLRAVQHHITQIRRAAGVAF